MKPLNLFTTKSLSELLILHFIGEKTATFSEINDFFTQIHMSIPAGSIYPAFARLRKSGFLSKALEEMDYGGYKQTFGLTDKGKIRLKTLKKELNKINNLVR